MTGDLSIISASFLSRGGEDILADYAPFEREFRIILSRPLRDAAEVATILRCVQHATAYASWRWDPRTATLQDLCGQTITAWSVEPAATLDLLCALLELSYFLTWCFNRSNLDQARLVLPDMRQVAEWAGTRSDGRIKQRRGPLKVAYLTRTADPTTAVSACMKHVVHVLQSKPERYQSVVYVWGHLDPRTPEWLRPLGAPVVHLEGSTPSEVVERITRQIVSDDVEVILSDMNNAVPTVLFSRRVAPVQGFLQIGLPAWGALNIDCVFNGFGFDPTLAGWGLADIYDFTPPWDLDDLAGPHEPERLEAEAEGLPPGLRVVGCYTRLVKITADYLNAVERILAARPDVCLLLGGTGDAGHIQSFIRQSPVGDRIILRQGFVSGRTWAYILYVFLDTWPFQGGGSIREVTVRGVPVVSMHSAEMPAMDREKDPELIAADWDHFVDLVLQLCDDEQAYDRARERALALAASMADRDRFATSFLHDLDHTIRRAEDRI